MIPIPAGCARFLCYGWIITGVCFVLGLNKNGEDLSGAGLIAIGLGWPTPCHRARTLQRRSVQASGLDPLLGVTSTSLRPARRSCACSS